MSDRETRIRAWRQALAQSIGDRPDVLDELESHLREELDRHLLAGRPFEEAWQAALAQMGDPQQLAVEFGKLPARPLRWLPGLLVAGLYALTTLGSFFPILAGFRDGNASPLLAAHVISVSAGYLATFAFGALAAWATLSRLWGRWDRRRVDCLRWWGWRYALVGLTLSALGVGLGSIWAREALGTFWTHDTREYGGLAVILWNALAVVLLQRRRSLRSGLLLGLGGNVVVAMGWFVANATALSGRELHSYGNPYTKGVLLGFFMAHAALLLLALLPLGGKDTMRPERAP